MDLLITIGWYVLVFAIGFTLGYLWAALEVLRYIISKIEDQKIDK